MKNNAVHVTAANPDHRRAASKRLDGDDITTGFNPQFLTDALRVVDSDEIDLELTAPH